MSSLAPHSETVALANEAITLPLGDTGRRRQLIWRLQGIVRKEPHDIVARTGLAVSLLIDGDRREAETQLQHLFEHRHAADSLSRRYFSQALACVGRMADASVVLYETLEAFPIEEMGSGPGSFAGLGFMIGDAEFFRRATNPKRDAEKATLEFIEKHALEQPIRLVTDSLAETICKVARVFDHAVNFDECGDVDSLYFGYRAPLSFKQRWQIERECLVLWRRKLEGAGLSWAKAAPFMTIGLDPFPSESRAAA